MPCSDPTHSHIWPQVGPFEIQHCECECYFCHRTYRSGGSYELWRHVNRAHKERDGMQIEPSRLTTKALSRRRARELIPSSDEQAAPQPKATRKQSLSNKLAIPSPRPAPGKSLGEVDALGDSPSLGSFPVQASGRAFRSSTLISSSWTLVTAPDRPLSGVIAGSSRGLDVPKTQTPGRKSTVSMPVTTRSSPAVAGPNGLLGEGVVTSDVPGLGAPRTRASKRKSLQTAFLPARSSIDASQRPALGEQLATSDSQSPSVSVALSRPYRVPIAPQEDPEASSGTGLIPSHQHPTASVSQLILAAESESTRTNSNSTGSVSPQAPTDMELRLKCTRCQRRRFACDKMIPVFDQWAKASRACVPQVPPRYDNVNSTPEGQGVEPRSDRVSSLVVTLKFPSAARHKRTRLEGHSSTDLQELDMVMGDALTTPRQDTNQVTVNERSEIHPSNKSPSPFGSIDPPALPLPTFGQEMIRGDPKSNGSEQRTASAQFRSVGETERAVDQKMTLYDTASDMNDNGALSDKVQPAKKTAPTINQRLIECDHVDSRGEGIAVSTRVESTERAAPTLGREVAEDDVINTSNSQRPRPSRIQLTEENASQFECPPTPQFYAPTPEPHPDDRYCEADARMDPNDPESEEKVKTKFKRGMRFLFNQGLNDGLEEQDFWELMIQDMALMKEGYWRDWIRSTVKYDACKTNYSSHN